MGMVERRRMQRILNSQSPLDGSCSILRCLLFVRHTMDYCDIILQAQRNADSVMFQNSWARANSLI